MEKLLNRLNGFGRYQRFIMLLIGLISSLTSFTVYSSIFTSARHKLNCYSKITNKTVENSCEIWQAMKTDSSLNQSYSCEFSDDYYGNTLVSEWGLQCNKYYMAAFLQTLFMIGCMFTVVGGWFGDRYGRRSVMICSAILLTLVITITEISIQKFDLSFKAQYTIYMVAQFFIGFLGNNLYITGYVLITELTSSQYSTFVSTFCLDMYIVGELMLFVFAYFERDWHSINTFVAIFSIIITLVIVIVIPESPRYLIANKYYEKCYNVLVRIANINGRGDVMFSKEKFFKQIESNSNGHDKSLRELQTTDNFHEIQSLLNIKLKSSTGDGEKDMEILEKHSGSILFFLMNPLKNLGKTLCMSYVWVALTMIYFGVSLGITSLGDNFNPYVMYVLSCAGEFVGYSVCFLNDRYSRKKMIIIFILSAVFFCSSVTFIPKDKFGVTSWRSVLTILFATLGKAAASASFNSVFVYTFRMFPTNVRNTLFGLCSSVGKIGSLISPQINLLRDLVWAPFPYIIFSVTAVFAVVLLLFLPDPSKFES